MIVEDRMELATKSVVDFLKGDGKDLVDDYLSYIKGKGKDLKPNYSEFVKLMRLSEGTIGGNVTFGSHLVKRADVTSYLREVYNENKI